MEEDYKNKHQYDDIINLQHHVSSNREHMSVLDRAAQFSPCQTDRPQNRAG
ncbi:MAG: hypothetical protein K0S01_647 [Herbinix sp.]|nr:hypothetical protein [Herbinix sp.]